jgi:primase-polymerase (primpol)-like protein
MMPNFDSIPEELKVYPNWVLWKLEERDGKYTKIPYQVYGKRADTTNPKTWATFESVKETFLNSKRKYNGIGFVLTEKAGIIGADWDKVRDPITGDFDKEALEEILCLFSYGELSQSETGAHVLIKGKITGDRRRKGNFEMYCKDRFFVVTGQHIEDTPLMIKENQEAINGLYEKKFGEEKQTISKRHLTLRNPDLTDEEIIQLCRTAGNNEKFTKLYDKGDCSDYEDDESRADLALCGLITFYTQKREQIDRLFSGSKLYRDKWDRTDYKERTINEVLSNQKEVFTGTKPKEEYSSELLNNIPIPDNPRDKLQTAKQFIEKNLMTLTISKAEEIIITDIKKHFNFSRDEIANLKRFYKELINNRHDKYAELSKNWNTDLNIDEEFEGLYTLHWNSEKTKVMDILLHFDKVAVKVLESLNTIAYKGQIYVYRDGYYEDAEEVVMQEITRIINGIRKGSFSSGIKSCSANVLHNIQYFNPVTEYPFNNENATIPVKNGIVVLDFENKTKILISHSPEYKFNYIIPTEYNENADPKPIDDILHQYSPNQVKELYQLPAQALMQM